MNKIRYLIYAIIFFTAFGAIIFLSFLKNSTSPAIPGHDGMYYYDAVYSELSVKKIKNKLQHLPVEKIPVDEDADILEYRIIFSMDNDEPITSIFEIEESSTPSLYLREIKGAVSNSSTEYEKRHAQYKKAFENIFFDTVENKLSN